jgi:hypothetical protein
MRTAIKNQIAVVLVTGITCFAQLAWGQTTVFGRPDCGVWLNKKREVDKAWLLGYVSSLSTSQQFGLSDPFGKISSAEQIFVWMDNYCQRNPLKDVGVGAFLLYIELLSSPK